MNNIKNIHRIKEYLTDEQLEKLEYSAFLYQRYISVFFKITIFKPDKQLIHIEIKQEKNLQGHYADKKRLIEIVEETFREYFLDFQIQKSVFQYILTPVEIVNNDWIKERIQKHKITKKNLVQGLGITKEEISEIINGRREIDIHTKGLFYHYFMNYKKKMTVT